MPSLVRGWRRFAARLVHAAWHWIQNVGAVTGETAAGRRFASFGPGSLIAFPIGSIYGERWIKVGAGTMIGEYTSICAGMAPGHDLGPDPVLRIGDRCVIGRGSHVVAHHSIDIGDDVFTGPYVYITDQNHSYTDPHLPIGRQWPVNAPVRIGAGTWLGTGAIVLPGSVIGRNVVVAAGAVVRGVIEDRCVVAGVPARVVKGFDPEAGWTKANGVDLSPQSATTPGKIVPAENASAEIAPAEIAPAEIAPASAGGAEAAAIVRTLAETALAQTGLAETALAQTVLTEPLAIDPQLAHRLPAEQDS